MSNHFHLLIEVPARHLRESLTDEELVRRFSLLYGEKGTIYMPVTVKKLKAILLTGGAQARSWRKLLRERMNDLPMFMKLLKQRFTQWYNTSHKTYGTFWASRYTSLLVESDAEILRKIACYIDLNPVRAGVTEDPAAYPWSGFGAAACGSIIMRESLVYLSTKKASIDTESDYVAYKQELYQRGAFAPDQTGKGGVIPAEIVCRVVINQNQVANGIKPFAENFSALLQCGYIMGSRAFISKYCSWAAALMGRKKVPQLASKESTDIHCLNRNLR